MDTRDIIIVGLLAIGFFYGEDIFCNYYEVNRSAVVLPDPSDWPSNINYVRSYSEMRTSEYGVCIGFPEGQMWDTRINFVAGSGSMRPTYSEGMSIIQLIPRNESDIHVGDIVVFNKTELPHVVHRVIDVGEDFEGWYAYTKGDNNKYGDQKMRFSDIKGIAWIDIR